MRTFYLALTLPWHGLIAILCEIRFVLSERIIILRYLGQGRGYLRVREKRIFSQSREPTDVSTTVCASRCKTVVS